MRHSLCRHPVPKAPPNELPTRRCDTVAAGTPSQGGARASPKGYRPSAMADLLDRLTTRKGCGYTVSYPCQGDTKAPMLRWPGPCALVSADSLTPHMSPSQALTEGEPPPPPEGCITTADNHSLPHPPRPKRPQREKTKFTLRKVLSGHFWYTNIWVPDTPPPFPLFYYTPPPAPRPPLFQ